MKIKNEVPVFKMGAFGTFSPEEVRIVTKGFSIRRGADKMLSQPFVATLTDMKRLTVGDYPQVVLEFFTERTYARFLYSLADGWIFHIQGANGYFVAIVCKLPKSLTIIKGNSVSTIGQAKDKIWLINLVDMRGSTMHYRGKPHLGNSGGNNIITDPMYQTSAITTKPRQANAPPKQVFQPCAWFVQNSHGYYEFVDPNIEVVFPPRDASYPTRSASPPSGA